MKCLICVLFVGLCSACSATITLDRIQDGSELVSSYRRDRWADYRSGMGMARELQQQRQEEQERQPSAESSPRQGWEPSWTK